MHLSWRFVLTAVIIVFVLAVAVAFSYQALTSQPAGSIYVKEYSLTSNSSPNAITVDAQGNVWFVEEGQTALAVLNRTTGMISTFPLPELANTTTATWGIAVDNSRKLVWFTDQISNSLWSFSTTNHTFTRYLLPASNSNPYDVALDQNGNVWFTEDWATRTNNTYWNRIGEITTSGQIKEFQIPHFNGLGNDTEGMAPSGITVSKNGTVWFGLVYANSIASFSNGRFVNYNLTGLGDQPVGIALDSSGNVWFTNHGASFISEFNPSTGYFRSISTSEFPPYNISLPYFIYIDPAGNVWFNEHQGNAIAKFDSTTNVLTEYRIPSEDPKFGIAGALTMALSSSGTPWFTELFTGKIGTVNSTLPIDLGISTRGSLQDTPPRVSISNSAAIELVITGNTSSSLRESVSNITKTSIFFTNLTFTFSPDSGNGNYSSTLTINNAGAPAGVYFVTISAVTDSLIVSQVIEVEVS